MPEQPWLLRGRIASAGSVTDDGWVLLDGRSIGAVGSGPGPQCRLAVDLGDFIVSPGFVDIHVHGGGGAEVAGETPGDVAEGIRATAAHHLRHGTTSLVPTLASDTTDRTIAAAAGVRIAMSAERTGEPSILGLHLEGPWLSPKRAGAHATDRLRAADADELDAVVAASAGGLRIVTLAPELPGSTELIAAGRQAGVTMSIGHTDAGFASARAALRAGASHLTHAGNAMRGIDRRDPGPIAAVLADPIATLEVIADGIHLHPAFLRLLAELAKERLVAVTDAVPACGMPDGRYHLGAVDVRLEHDRVVVADEPSTLAGSVLTMDRAVATLVGAGVELGAALHAATSAPASVVGAHTKGWFGPGADADLVVLDRDLRAVATVIDGYVALDKDGRLSAAGVPRVTDRHPGPAANSR